MREIIRNRNGNEYSILARKNCQMLLKNQTMEYTEYVVAIGWNGSDWIQGRYFSDRKEAKEYFNR